MPGLRELSAQFLDIIAAELEAHDEPFNHSHCVGKE